ncbi:MAG TPA: hypothetical protein VGO84_00515, partial [Burkholderiales bacterium]|nr:hypothetical protein [Burkholderiales bacterium]
MEKTQTNPASAARRVDPRLTGSAIGSGPFELSYLNIEEFAQHQVRFAGRLLGAIAFSATRPAITEPACPYAWVNMPVLAGDAVFEVWTSSTLVVREQAHGLTAARNDDLMFGCLTIEPGGMLDKASFSAYSRIFDFIDQHDYGHLLRAWNYVPQINADENGLERY